MIIVGELINASRKAIRAAIENQDAAAIQKIAKDQFEAGAHYIDVNAGTFLEREVECLPWLVETVQQVTDKPCAIDSPDPVRRVTPPRTTIANTNAQQISSQLATTRFCL